MSRDNLHSTGWVAGLGALAVVCLALFIPVQAGPARPARVEQQPKDTPTWQLNGGSEGSSILVHLAAAEDKEDCRAFAAQSGGRVAYEYDLLPHIVNLRDMPRAALEQLRTLPGVVKVEQDRRLHLQLNDSTPVIRAESSQLAAAGLSATGAGVRICIIDSGVDIDHSMYADRIDTAASFDFVEGDSDPDTSDSHGPHVTGIAAGRTGFLHDFGGGSGLEPVQGVAPEATIIAARACINSLQGCLQSDVIAALDHCSDPALPNGPADVINLSLGGGSFSGPCDGDTVAQAANQAAAAGVVVVAASANDANPNGIATPACASEVIAVGATFDDDFPNPDFPADDTFVFTHCTQVNPQLDELACFSNGGVELDVTAPGCRIFSASVQSGGTSITGKCGTSMAAPHVAGLAALILSADPLLTPAQVRQVIRDSAADLGPPGYDIGYGFGRIDATSALKLVSSCAVSADCDDGLFCNGLESCVGTQCMLGIPPCPDQICDESGDSCVACAGDEECDDGVVCNGAEACAGGLCVPGSDPPCLGQVGCDPSNNQCNPCVFDADCDDGDACTGIERCLLSACVRLIDDCNDNGQEDSCDIGDGTSLDVDPANGAPDECDAAVRFTFTEIPTLGGENGEAFGVNDLGQVVGTAQTGDFVGPDPMWAAFLFDTGTLTLLKGFNGAVSEARDINNSGYAVGSSDTLGDLAPPPQSTLAHNLPAQWFGNEIAQLNLLPLTDHFTGDAWAINESGRIVGASIELFQIPRATLWMSPQDPIDLLSVLINQSQARAINNVSGGGGFEGDLAGWMQIVSPCDLPRTRPFLLKAGTVSPMDLVGLGSDCFGEGIANDLNDAREVVGDSLSPGGGSRPFLWIEGLGASDLGDLGGSNASALAINNAAQIVGESETAGGAAHAFLKQDGVMRDLNDFAILPGGWVLESAADISESGHIVGRANDPLGRMRGFLLTPCGDPGNPCPSCQSDPECDDGLTCNGVETCVSSTCQAGTPVDCDDGVSCTDDACAEPGGTCSSMPNEALCDDGLFCNGAESCDAVNDCLAGSDPCPGQSCDEASDQCLGGCDNDGTCESGEDCNSCPNDCFSGSAVVCGNGICETADGENCLTCGADCNGQQSGKPSNRYCCGDGSAGQGPVDCGDPRCTGSGNTCTDVPAPASCCGDDVCEGGEDETNCAVDCACVNSADCDDADACTVDTCTAGVCVNDPVDCADGDACTADSCDPASGCVSQPIDCDDGDSCSTDSCDSATGCVNTFPPCGPSDGCCGPGCDPGNDADCFVCGGPAAACTSNADCCSNKCKGNGTCK